MADVKADPKVQEANQAISQAKGKRRLLAEEQAAIPAKIQDAALRNRREKASAAREGGDVATVGGDEAITELKAREAALPFEIWAADCEALQAEIDHLQAQQHVCAELRPKAEAKLADLAEQREKVNKEYAQAQQEIDSIHRQDPAGLQVNRKKDELRALEEAGPDV